MTLPSTQERASQTSSRTRRSMLRTLAVGSPLASGATAGIVGSASASDHLFELVRDVTYDEFRHEATLHCYVYPRTTARADEATAIVDAIDTGWSLLGGDGGANPVETLRVWRYVGDESPARSVDRPANDSGLAEELRAFVGWREATVPDFPGAHTLVTGGTGMAQPGSPTRAFAGARTSAYHAPVHQIVGVDGAIDRSKNLAVQELLHNVVDYTLDPILELLETHDGTVPETADDASHMAEHALGTVRGGDGTVTPMATLYEGSDDHVDDVLPWAEYGQCSGATDNWEGEYTLAPTNCTRRAVTLTAAREFE